MTGDYGEQMWQCANCGAEVDPITTAQTDTTTVAECPKCDDQDEIPHP